MVKKVTKKATKPAKAVASEENELDKDTLKLAESSDDESDFGGFSSTDEEDSDNEASEESEQEKEEPKPKAKTHSIKKPTKKKNATTETALAKNKRGIMYIGRLPKQVDEKDLKKYFNQFGDILNVRVSRNKKTGHSKHFGFIEFENYEVAKIAQETMNNYLLFNHLLKCELVENTEENKEKFLNLFAGTKNYKAVPWNKISKHRHDRNKTPEQAKKLAERHAAKVKARAEKLKAAGIDFGL